MKYGPRGQNWDHRMKFQKVYSGFMLEIIFYGRCSTVKCEGLSVCKLLRGEVLAEAGLGSVDFVERWLHRLDQRIIEESFQLEFVMQVNKHIFSKASSYKGLKSRICVPKVQMKRQKINFMCCFSNMVSSNDLADISIQ